MHNLLLFPRLRETVKLKRVLNYILLYGSHPSQVQRLHPSHALVLSLCTGSYSLADITYLFGETYNLCKEEAAEAVLTLTDYLGFALELLQEPDLHSTARYKPEDFIFPGGESVRDTLHAEWFPVPVGINLNLTFLCNFKCNYCYQLVSTNNHQRLDLAKCLSLVEEASEWGVVYFGMTGGEPTLFKGWLEVLDAVLSHGMTPVLTSNGVVIGSSPFIARRLYHMGLQNITISLDASYPELHDKITNSVNTFRRVINAIRYLVEAGIRVTIKSVLTPLNFHDLADFINFTVGLEVAEVGISYKEGGAIGSSANSTSSLTAQQLEAARSLVQDKGEFFKDRCTVYPPNPAACAWEGGVAPCGGMHMGISIFPSGDVSICDKLWNVKEFTYGNVFEQSLKEIWNGDAIERIRRRSMDPSQIDPDCATCSKLKECKTGCFVDSFNELGDYFAKHPNCIGPFASPELIYNP